MKAAILDLGIFSYFGYDLPLQRRLELIWQCGIKHTSIWWGPVESLVAAGRKHEIPSMVRDLGLTIQYMHAPYEQCNDLWSDSPAVRNRFLREHIEYLDDCVRHRLGCMVLHVSHGTSGPDPNAQGLEVFTKLANEAHQRGLTLAVENTRRDDILHFLFERIDSPALAFCYDSSHDRLWGSPYLGTLLRWEQRLVQTHFSDCDQDDRHLLPRDGRIDWPVLLDAFPRDYKGCLMLEVMPHGVESRLEPEEFLKQACACLAWLNQSISDRR